jgi:uncharacterized delta-60 repeat protein
MNQKFKTYKLAVLILTACGHLVSARADTNQVAGRLDPSFVNANVNGGAAFTQQPDGRWVVSGGSLYISSPFSSPSIVRFNDDGTLDTNAFTPVPSIKINGHVLLADGRILVMGSFTAIGGVTTRNLAVLQTNGLPDASFAVNNLADNNLPQALTRVPDGSGAYVGFNKGALLQINQDGTTNAAFQPALDTSDFYALAVQSSGKLLVVKGGNIFRLNPNGSRDNTYTETSFATTKPRIALAPDDSLYVAGATSLVNSNQFHTLIHLLPDGGVDPAFHYALDGVAVNDLTIACIALQPDGKLLVNIAGRTLSRVLPTGAVDTNFTSYAYCTALACDRLGRILGTGNYLQTSPTVISRAGVFRLYNDVNPTTPATPTLSFQLATDAAPGLIFPDWPAGYVLQHTYSLTPPDWQNYATNPPVTIPLAQPGEFFRLAPTNH